MHASSHTDSTHVKAATTGTDGPGGGAPAAGDDRGEAKRAAGDPGDEIRDSAPGDEIRDSAPGDEIHDSAPAGAADTAQERPRTKAAQREATVAALTAAARELFAERGYAGVGTEEIVQRAGVTRGALYHHFPGGKVDLFQAVLVEVSAEVVRTVVEVATAQDDPWEELVRGVEAFLDACARPDVQRIMLIDGPSVLGWEVWRAADGDYALSLLESALQGAIDAGRLIPQPARALAHVLLGAIEEAAMVVARSEDQAAARQEMGLTVRRLLEGLRAPGL